MEKVVAFYKDKFMIMNDLKTLRPFSNYSSFSQETNLLDKIFMVFNLNLFHSDGKYFIHSSQYFYYH